MVLPKTLSYSGSYNNHNVSIAFVNVNHIKNDGSFSVVVSDGDSVKNTSSFSFHVKNNNIKSIEYLKSSMSKSMFDECWMVLLRRSDK